MDAPKADKPAMKTTQQPWERKVPLVQAGDEAATELFFSWVIPGRLAGARALMTDADLKVLVDLGISLLVRLTEAQFVTAEQVQRAGLEDLHEPVPDFGVPTLEQATRIVERVQQTMSAGKAAVISCFAGHGRTGTMLSCCLVMQGLSAENAFRFMTLVGRPHAETDEQREFVRRFAASWPARHGSGTG